MNALCASSGMCEGVQLRDWWSGRAANAHLFRKHGTVGLLPLRGPKGDWATRCTAAHVPRADGACE